MRIAFYAPLKPPSHPVPSGDRRVARLLVTALRRAGHSVSVASRLRSWEGDGDRRRQRLIERRAAPIARRLCARYAAAAAGRPHLWFTYHMYHKAPDWLGPPVARALGIPYVVAEASVADRQRDGPWRDGYRASLAALRQAALVAGLNPRDRDGVLPHLRSSERWLDLPPFLDQAPYAAAAAARARHRRGLADRLGLDTTMPWLLAVGMMRPGDKLDSYRLLGRALQDLGEARWQLIVVGDGPERAAVESAIAGAGRERTVFAGQQSAKVLPAYYAAADLFVWPAVREAFGMAILEAQATGLAAVVGDVGGTRAIVRDGRTGCLMPPGRPDVFADAVARLLADPPRRAALGAAAANSVAERHGVAAASAMLDDALRRVLRERGA